MNSTHFGSCLCGAARFEIEGDFERFYLCHCKYCRKDTGSAHAANLFSSTATIKWLSGEESVKTYNLPSTRHVKSFCSTCGSALPNVQMSGKLLVIPAGSLDSDIATQPTAHIFVASKANWDCKLEAAPMIDKFPV